MTLINEIIETWIREHHPDPVYAILLSGGIDSLTLALAAHRVGKQVSAYSFRLDTRDNYDNWKAQQACRVFNWEHTECVVDTAQTRRDWDRLIALGCTRKAQYECTWPFLYVYPHIQEKEINSGIPADVYYGLSKNTILNHKHTKAVFDEDRRSKTAPDKAGGIQFHHKLAAEKGMRHRTQYLDNPELIEWFMSQDWEQLNKPREKHHLRAAYGRELARLRPVKGHANLQIESGVSAHFTRLLKDPDLNPNQRPSVIGMMNDYRKARA